MQEIYLGENLNRALAFNAARAAIAKAEGGAA